MWQIYVGDRYLLEHDSKGGVHKVRRFPVTPDASDRIGIQRH